jgi:3-deoxy-manno-octulosonate cytidylyltransferase (CMP-KDO synthetase)
MPTDLKVLAVIPARWASTRFPGKPMVLIKGRPMVQWVYERAKQAKLVDDVLVATDDDRILSAVTGFGGKAILTSPDHPTGTDRIAEAVRDINCDIVVNVQGDEPLIPPENIDCAVQCLLDDPSIPMSTLMTAIDNPDEFKDSNIVKVAVGKNGHALYFSRSPIPHDRDGSRFAGKNGCLGYKHIGLYVYKKTFLMKLNLLPEGDLEQVEKLEQLRVLENGYSIKVVVAPGTSIGVDCPKDLETVLKLIDSSTSAT